MKKELKFRVFDNISKKMNTVGSIWGFPEAEHVTFSVKHTVETLFSNFELMQFTGLKDKNGIEIYEGDIVIKMGEDWKILAHWIADDERREKPFPIVEINRDVVDTSVFGYWLKNETFGYEGEELQDPEHYQVIGNIHENPELLTQHKN